MTKLYKVELISDEINQDFANTMSYGDAIKFATKMVMEYEKKGFMANEFIELTTNQKIRNYVGWDTALYKYANYLFDLYGDKEMSMN